MAERVLNVCALIVLGTASVQGAGSESSVPWRFYERVARPAVPLVGNAGWVRNPIDAFIALEHEKLGLKPRPEGARHVLLRRVYLDLIGLPPSRDELHGFLADASPDAFEQVVDRLLASPQYGERWGRHWMDIWRYSDWAGWGEQVRDSQPHIWRWRDWIVESLNGDKSYDHMLLEMLAGDEIAPGDPGVLRATGFLARNFKLLSREQWMTDTVNHTAQAFLGVTLGCARCHDHKYDPIAQKEYYQVRAIFEPHNVRLDRVPGQPDTAKDGVPRVFDAEPGAQTFLYLRGDERNPDKEHPMVPAPPPVLGGPEFKVEPVSLPLTAAVPEKLEFVREDTLRASEEKIAGARAKLAKARKEPPPEEELRLLEMDVPLAEAMYAALAATIRVERLEENGAQEKDRAAWEEAALAAAAAQREAGVHEARRNRLAAEVELKKARAPAAAPAGDSAKAAAALKAAEEKLTQAEKQVTEAEAASGKPVTVEYKKRELKTYPPASTGRRLAFARWLTSRENPLCARVAVNHIWARHFGQGIVPSVFDFGRRSKPASHPDLLDWLAVELMEPAAASGAAPWSMKPIHRLIVTSSTYRQASTADDADLALDPDNRFLWRMPARRLEAEIVRDSLLHVAGRLDLAMGGPELDHQQGLTARRRSFYFRHAAEKQMTFLKLFDGPDAGECYERKESLVPQQALALANSQLALEQARALARALAAEISPVANGRAEPACFVTAAFEQVLSRRATVAELETCARFLAEEERFFSANRERLRQATENLSEIARPSADPALRARENLVHVLLNHNDFVTVR